LNALREIDEHGGVVGELAERLTLLAELEAAVGAPLADHQAKLALLTDEVYDIGLPRAMRTPGVGS
jgi:hypothetical protein